MRLVEQLARLHPLPGEELPTYRRSVTYATPRWPLAGMRSGAEALGGCLAVRSAPGQGTTVEIVLPVAIGSPGVVVGP